MRTSMICPISGCGAPVDDHTFDDECVDQECDLMVTEHGEYTQETYASEIHIYKCHSDHWFYMNPGEGRG